MTKVQAHIRAAFVVALILGWIIGTWFMATFFGGWGAAWFFLYPACVFVYGNVYSDLSE